MNCPKCNTPYDEYTEFCPNCGQALSNADFKPLSTETGNSKSKKGRVLTIIAIILLIAILAGVIGYFVALAIFRHKCREATDQIFKVAHDLDASSVDPRYLPDELKENPDLKVLLKKRITKALVDDGLPEALADHVIEAVDLDDICDDIVSTASYKILSVDGDLLSCKVTVETENLDYYEVLINMGNEIYSRLKDDKSLWESVLSFFSSLIGKDKDEKKEDKLPELRKELAQLYDEAKEKAERKSWKGVIEYGYKDGSWTLLSIDKKMFYYYYGLEKVLEYYPVD